MARRYYAGIGSRQTPPEIMGVMIGTASKLATMGYVLRSGGAEGADTAFEQGCDLAGGAKEIFLPWRNFNGNSSSLHEVPLKALEIAEQLHPAWGRLSQGAKKLHGRNSCQVLGADLETPVDFVLFWKPYGRGSGTDQALRIAEKNGIAAFGVSEKDTPDSIIGALSSGGYLKGGPHGA